VVITPPAPTSTPPTIVFDGTPSELQPPAPTPSPRPAAPTLPTPTPAPASAATPTPTARPATTAYTIRPGDTLISIAERHYGSQNYWDEIAQANPLIDPVRLKPGDVIQLPDRDSIDQRPPAPAPRGDGTVIHIVRPGQTLSHIAQEHYDDPTLWRVIYLNNRELIGSNPNRLAAGTRLEIPPKP
jgi:nucleoid-associated protein YgaU